MKLDWLEIDPTLRFGIILSYKIKYQRRDKKDVSKEMTSSNRTAVISGLNEYTDYDMSVAGTTSKGDGIFSAIVTQRTLEDRKYNILSSILRIYLPVCRMSQKVLYHSCFSCLQNETTYFDFLVP